MIVPGIFFAWVDAIDTTFLPEFARVDEYIFDLNMTHSEGNFPTLDVTIKNPYIGLFNPSRKRWAWLSYLDPTNNNHITPIFFGRIVAPPNNTQAEAITIQLLARSANWLRLKQLIADLQLRDDPFDPIFVSVDKQSDPDTLLEFRSAVWHYDRVPSGATPELQVNISDILYPEDGFEVFEETDHFYDAFDWVVNQQQLGTVIVKADVHWTQRSAGRFDLRTGNVNAWTGGSIVSGWPKGGQQLAGGYMVAAATAFGNAEYGSAQPHNLHWENREKDHTTGDTMSLDMRWTTYPAAGELIRYQISTQSGAVGSGSGAGGLFPGPGGGDPDLLNPTPTTADEGSPNIPLHVEWSELMVVYWSVFTTLILDYDVARPRHEKIAFRLNADLQPVFNDEGVQASVDSEIMVRPGADVGLPILKLFSWYTLQATGMTVRPGTIVQSTPEFVGGPLYAVALNTGVVGYTEPEWSDILGTQITDGTVTWAMIGSNVPSDFPTWRDVADANVEAGTIIRAQFYLTPPVDMWGQPMPTPPAGTHSFQIAINTGDTQPFSNGVDGVADTSPEWPEPRFSPTIGDTTVDGTVTWLSLGTGQEVDALLDLPLGINSGASTFFPKDRGQRAIRALINMARAKLRMRNRIVRISFDCKFERGLNLSCRKGVLIYDRRLPGGYAYGKITSYSLIASGGGPEGKNVEFICKVTAEASVGLVDLPHVASGSIVPVAGEGLYVESGYVEDGWQATTGTVVAGSTPGAVPGTALDVGYTPPEDNPRDDGVILPITNPDSVVIRKSWVVGRPVGAPEYVPNAVMPITNKYIDNRTGAIFENTILLPIPNGYTPATWQQDERTAFGSQQVTYVRFYPVTQFFCQLKDLNRPFSNQFNIKTTNLQMERMVDLEASAVSV